MHMKGWKSVLATRAAISCLILLSAGCATIATEMPGRFAFSDVMAEQETGASLFPSDAEVLSDEQILRVLEADVTVPAAARVALLHLDHRSLGRYYSWSNVYGGTAAQRFVDEDLVAMLRSASSVTEAVYLPSLLLPPERSVGYLREAAARFQSDLLYIFTTDCQIFVRERLLGADRSRASCTAEAALLDVRTGVVSFTAKASEEFLVEELRSDFDVTETIERAEESATRGAVRGTAAALLRFLDSASS